MDARQLQERLERAFPEASIRVDGGAGRFELGLVSSMFEGLNRVKRQQLVYRGLGDAIASGKGLNRVKRQQLVYRGLGDAIASGAVHAVTIIAQTPEEAGA